MSNMDWKGRGYSSSFDGSSRAPDKTVSKLTVQLSRRGEKAPQSRSQQPGRITCGNHTSFGWKQAAGQEGDISVTGRNNFPAPTNNLGHCFPQDGSDKWGGVVAENRSGIQEGGLIIPRPDHERSANSPGSCQSNSKLTDRLNDMSVNELPPASSDHISNCCAVEQNTSMHPVVENSEGATNGEVQLPDVNGASENQCAENPIMQNGHSQKGGEPGDSYGTTNGDIESQVEETARALAREAIQKALASEFVLSVTSAAANTLKAEYDGLVPQELPSATGTHNSDQMCGSDQVSETQRPLTELEVNGNAAHEAHKNPDGENYVVRDANGNGIVPQTGPRQNGARAASVNVNTNNNTNYPPVPPKPSRRGRAGIKCAPQCEQPLQEMPQAKASVPEISTKEVPKPTPSELVMPDDIIDCLPDLDELSVGAPSPPPVPTRPAFAFAKEGEMEPGEGDGIETNRSKAEAEDVAKAPAPDAENVTENEAENANIGASLPPPVPAKPAFLFPKEGEKRLVESDGKESNNSEGGLGNMAATPALGEDSIDKEAGEISVGAHFPPPPPLPARPVVVFAKEGERPVESDEKETNKAEAGSGDRATAPALNAENEAGDTSDYPASPPPVPARPSFAEENPLESGGKETDQSEVRSGDNTISSAVVDAEDAPEKGAESAPGPREVKGDPEPQQSTSTVSGNAHNEVIVDRSIVKEQVGDTGKLHEDALQLQSSSCATADAASAEVGKTKEIKEENDASEGQNNSEKCQPSTCQDNGKDELLSSTTTTTQNPLSPVIGEPKSVGSADTSSSSLSSLTRQTAAHASPPPPPPPPPPPVMDYTSKLSTACIQIAAVPAATVEENAVEKQKPVPEPKNEEKGMS